MSTLVLSKSFINICLFLSIFANVNILLKRIYNINYTSWWFLLIVWLRALFCYFTILLFYYFIILLFYLFIILPFYYFTFLLFYLFIILLFYYFTILLFYSFTISLFYYFTILLFYYFIILLFYYFINREITVIPLRNRETFKLSLTSRKQMKTWYFFSLIYLTFEIC